MIHRGLSHGTVTWSTSRTDFLIVCSRLTALTDPRDYPPREIKNIIKQQLSPSTDGAWTFSDAIGPETFPLSDGKLSTSITIIISDNWWKKEVKITFRNRMWRGNGLTRTRVGRWRTWQKPYRLFKIDLFPCRKSIPSWPMISTHLVRPKISLNN